MGSDRRPWHQLGHSSPALPIPTTTPTTPSSSHQHPRHFVHYTPLSQEEDSFVNNNGDGTLPLQDISEKQRTANSPTRSTSIDLSRPSHPRPHPHPHTNSAIRETSARVSLDSSRTRSPLPPRLSASSPLNPPHLNRFHSHDIHDGPRFPKLHFDCAFWIPERIRPWVPFLLWVLTSVGFLLAVTVWRTQVFKGACIKSITLLTLGMRR